MSFIGTFWMNIVWLVVGFAVCWFTKDWLHTRLIGIENKIYALRQQANALDAKLKSL